jgi:hypothetical protein
MQRGRVHSSPRASSFGRQDCASNRRKTGRYRASRIRRMSAVIRTAMRNSPIPASMPTAAAAHKAAALVRPRIVSPSRKIMPAPGKPTPVTIPAKTFSAVAAKCSTPAAVKAAAPRLTSPNVRSPAALPRASRSYPMTQPSRLPTKIRIRRTRSNFIVAPNGRLQSDCAVAPRWSSAERGQVLTRVRRRAA